MPAKKAKAPAAQKKTAAKPAMLAQRPVGKPTLKAASKAPAKAPVKVAKEGPIGSLKKMLGIGGAKGTPALPKGPTGKTAAPAAAPAAKGGKAAAPASTPAGKQVKGQPTPAPAAKAAAPAKGKRGKVPFDSGLPKTSLATSLRPQKAAPETVPGAPVCREVACELMATTGGYCRMHYIKNWKKIKRKEMILREKKLNSYIEELVSKYPDKYIEAIRQDLASEKDFAKVVADLEIDESLDDFETVETESAEGIIDNLKRDFDDEGDVF